MKNKFGYIVLIISLIMLTIACTKEQQPAGLILDETTNAVDTTYITASIPAAQTKNIFMEEATGVRCPNCPSGADELKAIKAVHPNVISASVYSPFLNYVQAPSKYDFNTQDADDLVHFIEGTDPQKPTATIDRLPKVVGGNSYFFSKTDWSTKVNELSTKTTPLNIDLVVTPGSIVNEYSVKTTITFTDTLTADLALSIYLIEDKVIDFQDSSTIEVDNYEHNHVLREIVTPIPGSPFLGSSPSKEKGRVVVRGHSFILPSNVVNKANCKIIGFVHKTGSSKEVIHVEEVDL